MAVSFETPLSLTWSPRRTPFRRDASSAEVSEMSMKRTTAVILSVIAVTLALVAVSCNGEPQPVSMPPLSTRKPSPLPRPLPTVPCTS